MTEDNICIHCKQAFKSTRNDANFCSSKCRQAAYRTRSEEKEARKLCTIGYKGKKLPDFINILKENKIKHVLDVRFSTISSMKTEFGEENIQYVLQNAGISYRSFKDLGVPTKIQEIYKTDQMSIPEFERFYRNHVGDIDMIALSHEIKEFGKTALMCLEQYALPQRKQKIACHRSILASILKETGEFDEVIHL